ncbi:MAG: transglycosylase domain-containing protein, partial [Clostridia bacterium]|nr:transglycosylase domain-containing protein [Clostridia bacterium]
MNWKRLTVLLSTVALTVALGSGAGYVLGAVRAVSALGDTEPAPALTSFVYDARGRLITPIPSAQFRIPVDIHKLPSYVVDAFIATEDRNFRRHPGIDFVGIARALVNDVFGRPLQGGSTITQQLARNAFPEMVGRERTLGRKVREALVAIELERRYTKDEILELYLNHIYFGRGAYGIEAAAQTYFSKSASQLTLAEAALLAGLPKAPNDYEPIGNPEAARGRRNVVLDLMVENGAITRQEAEAAKASPLVVKPGRTPQQKYEQAPHFVDYVLAQLLKRYPKEKVFSGGLRVYTTLDQDIQKAAEAAVHKALDRDFPLRPGQDNLQAAVVVIDPRTGYIVAMVGGRDHGGLLELNRAWHDPADPSVMGLRQPGSAIKPLVVYAPALAEGGYTAATVVD